MIRRRGLAILSALLALVVVALAITALTDYVSDDARRTMDQATAAQLEQMLMAGACDAKTHLTSTAGQSWNTDLPPELTEQGGKLQISVISMDAEQAAFQIVAHLEKRTSSQAIHFQKRNGSWELIDAQLE